MTAAVASGHAADASDPTPVDLDGLDLPGFRRAILDWYAKDGRTLPFRGTRDPYLVLVSETILQQTQVARGAPAWQLFTARFPTVEALAAAIPADVLRAWQGLGYNRRAINLQRAARIVVDELGGRFPVDVAGLERLPGVGPYTARAVAAIAYGLPVGAVDTNVRRVLGRVIAGHGSPPGRRRLQAIADEAVPPDRAGDWTHALMDLGSAVCRPRSPRCDACPVRDACRFARSGSVAGTPAQQPRSARERRPPFEQSSRWLRGRILDRLRAADREAWVELGGAFGFHGPEAVAAAIATMAGEGLLELRPGAPPSARLPLV